MNSHSSQIIKKPKLLQCKLKALLDSVSCWYVGKKCPNDNSMRCEMYVNVFFGCLIHWNSFTLSIVDAKVGDKSTCEKKSDTQNQTLYNMTTVFTCRLKLPAGMSSTNTLNSLLQQSIQLIKYSYTQEIINTCFPIRRQLISTEIHTCEDLTSSCLTND